MDNTSVPLLEVQSVRARQERFNRAMEKILSELLGYVGCMNGFSRGTPAPASLNNLQRIIRKFLLSVGLHVSYAVNLAEGIAKGGASGMGIAIGLATLMADESIGVTMNWQATFFSMFPQLGLNLISLLSISTAINSSHLVKLSNHHISMASAMPAMSATMYLVSIFRQPSR